MVLQHILSTMHRTDASFVGGMQCNCPVLVVNQANGVDDISTAVGNVPVRMITTPERGLSNSRNRLLENAEAEICILGDDDLLYISGYDEIIRRAYREHPDADIIAFSFTQSLTENTRRQFKKAKKLNIFTISKIASVELTFKTKSVSDAGISFCTLLGLGAKYGSSEENAFLADALRAGLKIWYVPETICYLLPDPPERVKWQQGFDRDYFVKRGACFYRIYGWSSMLFGAVFLLLKKRNIFKKVPLFSALKWMREGKRQFRKDEEDQKCS